jgi:hypothetical protein
VLAVSHTARGAGVDIQCIWYVPSSLSSNFGCHVFKSDKSLQDVREQVLATLNSNVVPTQLVGISFQEEDHPNQYQNYKGMIMHYGDCEEPVPKHEDIKGPVFNQHHIESNVDWSDCYSTIAKYISETGDSSNFVISTYN